MIQRGLIRGPGIPKPPIYREPRKAVVIHDGIAKKPRPIAPRKLSPTRKEK